MPSQFNNSENFSNCLFCDRSYLCSSYVTLMPEIFSDRCPNFVWLLIPGWVLWEADRELWTLSCRVIWDGDERIRPYNTIFHLVIGLRLRQKSKAVFFCWGTSKRNLTTEGNLPATVQAAEKWRQGSDSSCTLQIVIKKFFGFNLVWSINWVFIKIIKHYTNTLSLVNEKIKVSSRGIGI